MARLLQQSSLNDIGEYLLIFRSISGEKKNLLGNRKKYQDFISIDNLSLTSFL